MVDLFSTGQADSAAEDVGDRAQPDGLSETALALRNQLAALPSRNATEFLASVRKIARQVDVEANAVSEELAIIEESYPRILATLQKFKRDLLLLREEVCMLRNRYESSVAAFMELMRTHCPQLIPELQALSRKQVQLRRLKWVARGREILTFCRSQMKENNIDWLRLSKQFENACNHALENLELKPVYAGKLTDNSHEAFVDGLRTLVPELNDFAQNRLKEVLDSIRYPFEDSTDIRALSSQIATITSVLHLIYQIAEHNKTGTGYDNVCTVMLEPIGTRFAFHFYGERKTNDIWKPQWYLSQTLNWIQVNLPFFVTVLENISEQSERRKSPSSVFFKYLSDLPIAKTKALLKQETVLNDVLLFSHILDECISYESQLRELDPDAYSSCILSLFCEQDVLTRWIEIENECCLDRMDEMLSAPDRWKNRFNLMDDADQFLVCNCVDAFVSMLQSQQSRSRLLPDIVAQRRFLDLQLLLTDDFRKRLAQIANQAESPWSEPFPNVMNAIWYLRHAVEEWSDFCLLSGVASTGGRAVFDESSAMFKHVWNQMAEDVVVSLRLQTIDVMKPYQQHYWCVMEPRLGTSSRDLTALFCPVLTKIRTTFATTGAQISKASLEELFKRMSSALSTVITEEIVDVTPFSAEGAAQMLFDMENGLIPVLSHIFSRHGVTPNMYYDEAFTTLLGSLKLLSLPWAVITLLKEEIEQAPDEIAEEKLFEMKVYGVNKEIAKRLIRLRSDIKK
ncbi:hypothetical protein Q1695_012481 [Nippostrongylus brasiliensis]|nr:hypothetical protein Q1695_012481 [Nippostrongylus brasiliensis]